MPRGVDAQSIVQIVSVTLLLAMSAGCAHRSPQSKDARGRSGNSITIKGSDTMVLLAGWAFFRIDLGNFTQDIPITCFNFNQMSALASAS
jgi:hypothetical protein